MVWRDRNFDVVQLTDDWLELRVVNTVKWLDDYQIVFLLFIFLYCGFYWSEVFLVADVNVIEKRALARQESAAEFKTFCVPKLTLLLLRWCVK